MNSTASASPRPGAGNTVGSISAAAPRLLREILAERGADDLAEAAGIGDGGPARVPAEDVLALLDRAADALADPLFGAHLGRDHQPGRLGLLDYLFLTSSTLREAFDTAVRYGPVSAAYGAYRWSATGGVEREFPAGTGYRQAEGFVLGWQLTMARYATRRPLRPVRVRLTQPAGENRDELAAVCGTDRIEFGCPATTVAWSPADLALPLPGADPLLAASLRRHADGRRPAPAPWPDRVRAYLAAGFTAGPVTLASAARHLAVGPRTLQQHLRDAGTSWQRELDTARDELARELLADVRLPVAAIAQRLGYAEARSFRRAFRRGNGCSPDQFRLRGNGPR